MSCISIDGLNTVIDNLEEGVLFLDDKRTVVAINSAAADMIGRQDEPLIGTMCLSLFKETECGKDCAQRRVCSLLDLEDGEKIHDLDLRRPDDTTISLRMWALPLPGEAQANCAVVLRNRTHERELEVEASTRLRLGSLIGHSQVMQRLFRDILRIAASDASVLIQGESGTGKELVGHALHDNSRRADAPYIRVHCAALPENLLESELFGHAKGSFTGATADRQGRFEAADGGTLLLDEIGEISPSIQVKLLRVLQEREVERLGENKSRKIDVRLIAATNRDLAAMVKEGTFREDLFYRLRVLPLQVPALRQRLEDVPMLATHISGELAKRYDRGDVEISSDAMAVLSAYSWPGNVRELGNALEFALVQSDGAIILPRHLPPEIRYVSTETAPQTLEEVPQTVPSFGYYRASAQKGDEKEQIIRALEDSGGNRAVAARMLGMSRTTLWKRLKRYGLA